MLHHRTRSFRLLFVERGFCAGRLVSGSREDHRRIHGPRLTPLGRRILQLANFALTPVLHTFQDGKMGWHRMPACRFWPTGRDGGESPRTENEPERSRDLWIMASDELVFVFAVTLDWRLAMVQLRCCRHQAELTSRKPRNGAVLSRAGLWLFERE